MLITKMTQLPIPYLRFSFLVGIIFCSAAISLCAGDNQPLLVPETTRVSLKEAEKIRLDLKRQRIVDADKWLEAQRKSIETLRAAIGKLDADIKLMREKIEKTDVSPAKLKSLSHQVDLIGRAATKIFPEQSAAANWHPNAEQQELMLRYASAKASFWNAAVDFAQAKDIQRQIDEKMTEKEKRESELAPRIFAYTFGIQFFYAEKSNQADASAGVASASARLVKLDTERKKRETTHVAPIPQPKSLEEKDIAYMKELELIKLSKDTSERAVRESLSRIAELKAKIEANERETTSTKERLAEIGDIDARREAAIEELEKVRDDAIKAIPEVAMKGEGAVKETVEVALKYVNAQGEVWQVELDWGESIDLAGEIESLGATNQQLNTQLAMATFVHALVVGISTGSLPSQEIAQRITAARKQAELLLPKATQAVAEHQARAKGSGDGPGMHGDLMGGRAGNGGDGRGSGNAGTANGKDNKGFGEVNLIDRNGNTVEHSGFSGPPDPPIEGKKP